LPPILRVGLADNRLSKEDATGGGKEDTVPLAHRPRVSIGMPVFNSERYLEEALNSLLNQSFEDFEVVISDNASTDGTEEICRSYAAKDDRIRYIRNRTNHGIIYNFKQVFKLSSGEYFKWAAADDLCGRDYLLRAVEMLDSDPSVVLVWGRTQRIDEEGKPVNMGHEISDLNSPESTYSPDPVVRWRRLMHNIWWVDGPFYGVMRADLLAKTPIHRAHVSGDQMLIAEMCLFGRFYEIPEYLFFNRMHTAKTSRVKTRRERAVLLETGRSKGKRLQSLKLVKLYVSRPITYLNIVRKAPISPSEKARCTSEVISAGLRWLRKPGRGGY
jgi:glycosyltransferase involved in cell wall biosynthesis